MESLIEAASRRVISLTMLSFVLATGFVAGVAPPHDAASRPSRYQTPVDRPVIDAFRRPVNPFAAGNRGLEYGTRPGDPVDAINDGVVTFAGQVAGARYITVTHVDGLRSSYSYLGRVEVVVGQSVRGGQRVGTAGQSAFHLGVRRGRIYLDPARLFASFRQPTHAILVRRVRFDVDQSRVVPR